MPHVCIKMMAGRSEELKQKLADQITKEVMEIVGCAEKSVSVAIEDVKQEDWTEEVYKPEILPKMEKLYKKSGYDPL